MELATIILLIVLICLCIFSVFMVAVTLTIFSGAPWVPTNKAITRAMCGLGGIKPGDRVVDLGCGDASMLLVAAREYGAVCIGIELNPVLVWLARWRAYRNGVSDMVTIIRGNIFKVDLPDTDVVVLYLLPKAMQKIEQRLRDRYTHVKVLSHDFTLSGGATIKKEQPVGRATARLYEW
ncbi:hypothetical protein COV06_01230 [Candidatus Uhrbacteria bacterium CG10_big_fil_rev_8_21_14_0_10_50_16]|uniref:Methyltransferase domain-containing protein n=1 Tax=Candidatus Uhrbacteria bacterium CG10_big_fil_rev_8_21_14_0_10_50_16 TaxID=1975039 RepID=A0A2H0RPU3_9BACT|nr:MAG: hypothetical protein COV06_01230 [Candidatus Uhrbacteria bacterium CG10_big_fil_rev_8_21_14_0_10_50_16]